LARLLSLEIAVDEVEDEIGVDAIEMPKPGRRLTRKT
jgi:hypothetical protein